jgi:hypothetical protein
LLIIAMLVSGQAPSSLCQKAKRRLIAYGALRHPRLFDRAVAMSVCYKRRTLMG